MNTLRKLKTAAAGLALMAGLAACELEYPSAEENLDGLYSKSAVIQGTWTVSAATQIDDDAISRGFPFQTLDLDSIYPAYTSVAITFNADGTYALNLGTLSAELNFIGSTSGTWSFDDPTFATEVTLEGSGRTSVLKIVQAFSGPDDSEVALRFVRQPTGSTRALVSYEYDFTR